MMSRNTCFIVAILLLLPLVWSGCAQKTPEELHATATEAHEAGEIDKAVKNYQKLVEKYPDSELTLKARFMSSYLSSDTTEKDVSAADLAYQEHFFNEAQQLQIDGKFEEAVTYYQKFLAEYPENEKYAYKAQFMIGFIYNESLKDTAMARQAFKKVLADYPENDLSDDARWMIENLDKGPEDIITGEDRE
ncbi:MAG: tetratricopeptide repeat protein [Gemmatimonadota bacterium]|nr:MAG: tetratricopeptide repeat protein [Gemmatimonadota bacterium]